jgi:hypothetical protein
MLQNLETEFNTSLLSELNKRLEHKKTKLILYTYDSFLFDYSISDGKETLNEIIQVFDGIPFHVKAGKNYHELKQIKL